MSARESPALSAAEAFDEIFRRIASSSVAREIWRAAFAEESPDQASPFSFVTRTELSRLAQALGVAPSDRLVDLGCGCGRPGLLLASRTGASLDGIDTSAVAVEFAAAAAAQMLMEKTSTMRLSADARATLRPRS